LTAPERIAAIVLAAGLSTRFGGDKLLHNLDGKPLGAHIVDTLHELELGWQIVVCTAERKPIYLWRWLDIVENPEPERGMGGSLALGARRAMALGAEAVLVCLADMPFVTADHLKALIAAPGDSIVTLANGTRTPPALFGARYLPLLAELTGDRGARDLLRDAAIVEASPGIVRDIDVPSDLS
jgi:molybdenum cofactor cytidylyltransferase